MLPAWLIYPVAAIVIAVVALVAWRQSDRAADDSAWRSLATQNDGKSGIFDLAMIENLPEPAQRYFRYMIEPGTALCTAVEIKMTGELGLGSKDEPNYQSMQAHQILSPPNGLVWKLKSGAISGSDGALPDRSWTRFWLFGLFPVVRANGPDHHRSAFGRVIAEAAMWAPASLLPAQFVRWESPDGKIARAIVEFGEFTQSVDISFNDQGAPSTVLIERWSNENDDKAFREQPFGGVLSDFKMFGGYRLPTRVEGGNHMGTPAYFPFFKADVSNITCANR